MTDRALVAAGAAACLVAFTIVVVATADFPVVSSALSVPSGPAISVASAVAWLGAGFVAWRRRPGNRVGPVMVAIGAAILLPWALAPAGALGFTLALLLDDVATLLGAYLFLLFPGGRLTGRAERVVMWIAALGVVVVSSVEPLFRDYRGEGCRTCQANLLLVDGNVEVADAIVALVRFAAVILAASIVAILVRRWRFAGAPARRALAPVLWTCVVVVLLFGAGFATERTYTDETLARIATLAGALIPVAFLAGLLRARLQRAAVSDLVVGLGVPLAPAQLRELLAQALGDPSLELAFWLPEDERFVNAEGRPVAPPQPDAVRAVSIVDDGGVLLASLSFDRSLLEDPQLVESVASAARLALANSRLQAELRAQLLVVRDSRARIVAAGDAERRRIERNLHDGAQQRLLGLRLAVRLARTSASGAPEALDAQLAEIDAELAGTLDELRALAHGLHPPTLAEEGLRPALEALARRAAIAVELASIPDGRMPGPVETTAYYVAAEGLANVVKHAHASHVRIAVSRADGRAIVEVADDGRGGADAQGSGLRGLRDRVEALDGTLTVSSRPERGTTLRAELPCA